MLDKTYRPAEVEAKHYARWEASGAFACDPNSDRPRFSMMMPPPNVTGSLHMGHALNMTIQDLLTRYHRMRGQDALWQPGTDHAGIATQMVVERQLAREQKTRADLGRDAFLDRVWQWKAESGSTITRQLRRLGASPDWSRERFTMDEGLSHAVRKVFVDLHKRNLIYRDKRLVNWDPVLHTAISDLEVESREIEGNLWHIRYPVQGSHREYIVVATTRPETMLGDSAVAVNPEDTRYKHLIGRHATLPLVGRSIPIVADDYADPKTGSGAVKITPAHDFNDFEVGRRHGLDLINILDCDGRINENAPPAYRGLDRFEARARIVADLESMELLERVDPHRHAVPHGDRSGTAIEPWLTDQWYLDAATLARPAIAAVEDGRTEFVPDFWRNTYFEWMRNIQPWCISRQIWWGHRIPAWYGPDGRAFVELDEAAALEAAKKHYGRATDLARDPDVLDTWFSSGLWPFSTLGWPEETAALKKYYPTDVLVTGFDIIFFWVARMMMLGMHFTGEVPFRTVYIHALVRDERGQKMSKSKGNIIDPLELIDKYGADALRFTLCALAAPGRDIKLSENRVESGRNFVTKLWNAARYAEMNGCRPEPHFDPAANELRVNRWIVTEIARLGRDLDRALASYRFHDAANAIYAFTWGNFCDWYLEFTKPILQGEDEAAKAETRATTAWAIERLLRLMHPIMPFVTEELFETFAPKGAGCGTDQGLIRTDWPEFGDRLIDEEAAGELDWLVRTIAGIRAARGEMNVPAAAQLTLVVSDANPVTTGRLARYDAILCQMARLEKVEPGGAVPKGALQLVVDEATMALPLAGVIDFPKERARLEKEIRRLVQDMAKIDAKLANESFIAKAPPEVIAEQRERRDEAERARGKLAEALARIAAI